jgi:hypothetical protein
MGAVQMKRKVTTIIVGLTLLIMAAVPAGVNASSADQAQSGLSSLPAIEAYLRSIGVDPGSVVVQQGPLNYAGSECPGAEWNCTTASKVVQISSPTSPGANIFDCLPAIDASIPALNECLIVQSSLLSIVDPPPQNSATCSSEILDGPGKSKCKVKQQSKKGNNFAEVRARITQGGGGSSQSATQTGEITQSSEGGNNTAKISLTIQQTLNIGTNDDPTQKQDAFQTANVTQTSTSGTNSSDVQQTMTQVENAQSNLNITQEQNTGAPPFPLPPTARNQEASVSQTTAAPGTNTSNLGHLITQRQAADCPSCAVMQTQGSPSGGQRGTVTQTTGMVAQTTIAALNEDQQQVADTHGGGTWTRSQFGPQDCCGEQFGGTGGNLDTVDLTSTQQNGGGSTTSTQNATCTEDAAAIALGAQCSTHVKATQNGTTNQQQCPPPNFGSCSSFQSCSNTVCGGEFAPLRTTLQPSPLSAIPAGAVALVAPRTDAIRVAGG